MRQTTKRAVAAAVIGVVGGIGCAALAAASPPAALGLLVYGVPIGAVVGAIAGMSIWLGASTIFRVVTRRASSAAWLLSLSFAAAASAAVVAASLSGLDALVVGIAAGGAACVAVFASSVDNRRSAEPLHPSAHASR